MASGLPIAPVCRTDENRLPRARVYPQAIKGTATRKYQRVDASPVDHCEFKIAIERGAFDGLPVHGISSSKSINLSIQCANKTRHTLSGINRNKKAPTVAGADQKSGRNLRAFSGQAVRACPADAVSAMAIGPQHMALSDRCRRPSAARTVRVGLPHHVGANATFRCRRRCHWPRCASDPCSAF